MFSELENTFSKLEITCSANWRIRSVNWRIRSTNWRFGETWLATTLVELVIKWRKNPVIVSGDLNHSGEKMEKNYGNQNFIHHKVESTYLRHFKDRNI